MLDWENVQRVAGTVARKVGRNYRDVQPDDISQELMEWTVVNQETVEGWLIEVNSEEQADKGVRWLYKTFYRLAGRYVRRERARMTGYKVQDEWFYSLAMLRALLPLYFGEHVIPDTDAKMDVERALGMIDYQTYNTLRLAYDGDGPLEERYRVIAQAQDCTVDTAENRVRRALAELQDVLGGPSPWTGRRAVSNAQAAAITHGDYDE